MKRRAILIEASAAPGQDLLPGAALDVDTLKAWLSSNPGGAWEEDEIKVLRNPNISLVKANLILARSCDFAFITFSGHGSHPRGGDFDETEILVNDGILRASDLNCGAPRCSIVIDACRYVGPEIITESFKRGVGVVKYSRDRTREAHREMFELEVNSSDKGAIFMFSCDINEFAGESSLTGGYFTKYLVESGNAWYEKNSGRGVLNTQMAFLTTSLGVTQRVPQQHPKYEAGRRMRHFPFSVRV